MQDAEIAITETQAAAKPTPIWLREDTILGVCQSLGDDFGFNPLWLRVALSSGVLWNPAAIVGIYLGLGVLVAISRFFFPPATKAVPAETAAQAPAEAECSVEQVQEERELIAA